MMFVFNSVFKNEFEIYLALRRKTVTPESAYRIENILSSFDRHLTQSELSEKTITETTINSWIQSLSEINSERTISDKVSCIRKWLEHLHFCGFPVFIPTCPKYSIDYVPYIFSDEEVDKLFITADEMNFTINRRNNNIRFTLPMLIRLLYGCGLRLGETLSLRICDIDFENGTLFLKHAKNKKQRIVPMHHTLTQILRRYRTVMRLIKNSEAFLFPSNKPGKHLSQASARYGFKKILAAADIYVPLERPHKRNQCLHCFRHLFAINTN